MQGCCFQFPLGFDERPLIQECDGNFSPSGMITTSKGAVASDNVGFGTTSKLGPKKPNAQLISEFSIRDWPVVLRTGFGRAVPLGYDPLYAS